MNNYIFFNLLYCDVFAKLIKYNLILSFDFVRRMLPSAKGMEISTLLTLLTNLNKMSLFRVIACLAMNLNKLIWKSTSNPRMLHLIQIVFLLNLTTPTTPKLTKLRIRRYVKVTTFSFRSIVWIVCIILRICHRAVAPSRNSSRK